MGEEKKIEPESQQVTRRFIEVYWRCTVDTRPHALNSEQRLRRAGRFSPSATWPLPPLFQLEKEREREREIEDRSPYNILSADLRPLMGGALIPLPARR